MPRFDNQGIDMPGLLTGIATFASPGSSLPRQERGQRLNNPTQMHLIAPLSRC